MTDKINGEDYDRVMLEALNVLMDYGITSFPIRLDVLANKLHIRLIPYSTLKNVIYESLLKQDRLFGFCVEKKDTRYGWKSYDLYYNDVDNNCARCRFTIAHEIGHIVLGHCDKDEIDERDEALADYFAKCLLAPQCIIISEDLPCAEAIADRFGLSLQSSTFWFAATAKRKYSYGNKLFPVEEMFMDSIHQI